MKEAKTLVCNKTIFRRVRKKGPMQARWEVMGSWGWEIITKSNLRIALKVAK